MIKAVIVAGGSDGHPVPALFIDGIHTHGQQITFNLRGDLDEAVCLKNALDEKFGENGPAVVTADPEPLTRGPQALPEPLRWGVHATHHKHDEDNHMHSITLVYNAENRSASLDARVLPRCLIGVV